MENCLDVDSTTSKTDEVSDLSNLKGRHHENMNKFPHLVPKTKHDIQYVSIVDP